MEECRHTVLPAPTPELLSALPGIGPLGDPRLWAGAARGSGVAVECHLLERGGERAFCSVYPLRLNLLTYSRARLSWPVRLCALPCSVGAPGYWASSPGMRELLFRYLAALPGGLLVLNTEEFQDTPGFVRGRTLPACVLDLRWDSFEAYMGSLRAPYRRRLRLARAALPGLAIRDLPRREFTQGHYALYENIYRRSAVPVEKLTIDFFRDLPGELVEFSLDGECVGFVQLLGRGDTLWFFFCGMADGLPWRADLYYLMLCEIVRRGIEGGYRTVDLGQTTEETKTRFGARIEERGFYARHANPLVHRLLAAGKGLLEYRDVPAAHRPFK